MLFLIDIIDVLIRDAQRRNRWDLVVYMRPDQIEHMKGIRSIDGYQVVPMNHKRWRAAIAQDSTGWAWCIGEGDIDFHEYANGIPETSR